MGNQNAEEEKFKGYNCKRRVKGGKEEKKRHKMVRKGMHVDRSREI